MPYEPTTPESKDIPSTVSKDITHMHIIGLNIHVDPNDAAATSVDVEWVEGYMEASTFISVDHHQITLSGPDLITKITEITDGTTSVYNNVKQRTWAMLVAEGKVPAGNIT